MDKTYRPYDPEQLFLLPPSLRDWLPEDHLVHFLSDLVDELDLSTITAVYEQEARGYPPYHPRMMVKPLLYAYTLGVPSSRKIASAVRRMSPSECSRGTTLPTSGRSATSGNAT
jgi:transposase